MYDDRCFVCQRDQFKQRCEHTYSVSSYTLDTSRILLVMEHHLYQESTDGRSPSLPSLPLLSPDINRVQTIDAHGCSTHRLHRSKVLYPVLEGQWKPLQGRSVQRRQGEPRIALSHRLYTWERDRCQGTTTLTSCRLLWDVLDSCLLDS